MRAHSLPTSLGLSADSEASILPRPDPTCPFVGLTPYSEAQAPFFFGRERERTLIIANLMASRLTLLYGPSGVGKSSVLRAGVLHHLQTLAAERKAKNGAVRFAAAIYRSWSEDPVTGLLEAAHRSVVEAMDGRQIAPPVRNQSLAAALTALTCLRPAEDSANGQRSISLNLLLVLDQFEEFFLYPQKPGERSFTSEFAEALNQPELNVNFLISLREDYVASLDRFKGRIPYLFDNTLRIKHLSRDAARDAIEGPIAAYNRLHGSGAEIKIKADLVETVLDQVKINEVTLGEEDTESYGVKSDERTTSQLVETPYLQLVMTHLWQKEMADKSRILRLSTLTKLKGARNIVRTHVDSVMNIFSLDQQRDAALMFRHLVTPSGTKIALFPSDLATLAERPEADLRKTLGELADPGTGILTIVDPPPDRPDEPRYEIRHDALAPAILDWRDRFVRRQKSAEDIEKLARERRRVKRLRLVLAGVFSLLVVMVALAAYAYYLRQQARSLELASQALVEGLDPEVSVLLANEAVKAKHTEPAEYALRTSLLRVDLREALIGHTNWVNSGTFSPNGRYVVTASGDDTARVWDLVLHKSVELKGHTDGLFSASFSSDSKNVVTASSDHTARVWEAETGRLIATFEGHEDRVMSANFSPDGKRVVTASEDDSAQVWNAETGGRVHVLREAKVRGNQDHMNEARYSPDGRMIVTASWDNLARIWDAQTGGLLHKLPHGSLVHTAKFNSDNTKIVTASQDRKARVWNAGTGALLQELPETEGYDDDTIYDASFSPDGSLIVTAGKEGKARVWNWENAEQRANPIVLMVESEAGSGAYAAAFSPDGNYVVTAGKDGKARVWHAHSGRPIAVLKGHTKPLQSAEFSPDGRYIITASQDRTARVWKSGIHSDVVPLVVSEDKGGKENIQYSPDGRFLYLGGTGGQVWDLHKMTFRDHTFVRKVSFSPDGKFFLGITHSDVLVWESSKGNVFKATSSTTGKVAVFSPNQQYVGIGEDGGVAKLWNPSSDQVVVLRGHDTGYIVSSIAFSPDSERVVTGSGDATARLCDVKTGNSIAVMSGHQKGIISIAYSPDGTRIVTTSEDSTARIWDATGAPKAQLKGHEGRVTRVTISRDSRFAVTSSEDGTARVWDLASGNNVALLKGHVGAVTSAVFSPDGRIIVTTGVDSLARAWEWQTEIGRTVPAVLIGHEGVVNNAAFSPDGRFVTTVSADGTARIFPWEKFAAVDDLLALVKFRVTRTLTPEEKKKYF